MSTGHRVRSFRVDAVSARGPAAPRKGMPQLVPAGDPQPIVGAILDTYGGTLSMLKERALTPAMVAMRREVVDALVAAGWTYRQIKAVTGMCVDTIRHARSRLQAQQGLPVDPLDVPTRKRMLLPFVGPHFVAGQGERRDCTHDAEVTTCLDNMARRYRTSGMTLPDTCRCPADCAYYVARDRRAERDAAATCGLGSIGGAQYPHW